MKKMKLRKWVKIVLTLIVIHLSFFIWKQTGVFGARANSDNVYLVLTLLSWLYLVFGQTLIYKAIWEN